MNQWAVGYFRTATRQPSEHRSGGWAMTQGWKHFLGSVCMKMGWDRTVPYFEVNWVKYMDLPPIPQCRG